MEKKIIKIIKKTPIVTVKTFVKKRASVMTLQEIELAKFDIEAGRPICKGKKIIGYHVWV